MKLTKELTFDFDMAGPKITASEHAAVMDNVLQVVLVRDTQVVVRTRRCFVAISGSGFVIHEIWEGRMELEGNIQEIEFYQTLGAHPATGLSAGAAAEPGAGAGHGAAPGGISG